MKTVTISEAVRDLASLLKQAVAGEEIGIRSDNTIVALRPTPIDEGIPQRVPISPREALQQLQRNAHLTSAQAQSYMKEVHAERIATEKHTA